MLNISRCSLNISRLKKLLLAWDGISRSVCWHVRFGTHSHLLWHALLEQSFSHLLLLAGDLHNIFKYSKRFRHPGQQTKHALYLILPQISHNWSVIIPVTKHPGQLWDRIFHTVMSSSVNKANPQEWVWGMVDPEKWGIGVCFEAGWHNPHVAIYLFTSITLHFSKHWNSTRTKLIADLQSPVQWGLFLVIAISSNKCSKHKRLTTA